MPRLTLSSSYLRIPAPIVRPSPFEASRRTATQWAGERPKEGHVVNRTDANDVQSEASQSGMKQKEEGKEGSQGISQKDERDSNKKAAEDHPEAPKPVIGMNDERAQVRKEV